MEARAYIGWVGWETPVARGGGATGPLPPHTPGQGPLYKFKKNYINILSPLGRATGGHFRKFSKRTYIFKIFIFLNIKKKKTPDLRPKA